MGDNNSNQANQQKSVSDQLKWLTNKIQEQEQAQTKMLREMRRTRRAVASVWFAELISPLLAILLVAGVGYYGVKFAEQQYLGGMDVFAEVHASLKKYGEQFTQRQASDQSSQ